MNLSGKAVTLSSKIIGHHSYIHRLKTAPMELTEPVINQRKYLVAFNFYHHYQQTVKRAINSLQMSDIRFLQGFFVQFSLALGPLILC